MHWNINVEEEAEVGDDYFVFVFWYKEFIIASCSWNAEYSQNNVYMFVLSPDA